MNQRVKLKWVKALRSGEFTQTTEKLRTATRKEHSYCCLGVLCELHRREKAPTRRWGCTQEGQATYLTHYAGLPAEVVKWAGLKPSHTEKMSTDCWPDPRNADKPAFTVHAGARYGTLDHLNDTNHLSFSEIADVIESQL